MNVQKTAVILPQLHFFYRKSIRSIGIIRFLLWIEYVRLRRQSERLSHQDHGKHHYKEIKKGREKLLATVQQLSNSRKEEHLAGRQLPSLSDVEHLNTLGWSADNLVEPLVPRISSVDPELLRLTPIALAEEQENLRSLSDRQLPNIQDLEQELNVRVYGDAANTEDLMCLELYNIESVYASTNPAALSSDPKERLPTINNVRARLRQVTMGRRKILNELQEKEMFTQRRSTKRLREKRERTMYQEY